MTHRLTLWLLLLSACGANAPAPAAPPPGPVASAAPARSAAPPAAKAVPEVAPETKAQQESWFPLVEGAVYTYHWTFRGRTDDEKLLVRRRGPSFYFVEAKYADDPNPIIGSKMPGAGAYAASDGAVLTGKAFWLKELANAQPTDVFLPKNPETGKSLTFHTGDHDVTFTFRGTKTVKVPAGEFRDALDVELFAEAVKGDIVFARGVGIVYWKRQTGRVDELVAYEPPK